MLGAIAYALVASTKPPPNDEPPRQEQFLARTVDNTRFVAVQVLELESTLPQAATQAPPLEMRFGSVNQDRIGRWINPASRRRMLRDENGAPLLMIASGGEVLVAAGPLPDVTAAIATKQQADLVTIDGSVFAVVRSAWVRDLEGAGEAGLTLEFADELAGVRGVVTIGIRGVAGERQTAGKLE